MPTRLAERDCGQLHLTCEGEPVGFRSVIALACQRRKGGGCLRQRGEVRPAAGGVDLGKINSILARARCCDFPVLEPNNLGTMWG